MDRREALDILGLSAAPTPQEIEHRYDILIKRAKGATDPDALTKVTEAYNLLTGRTYVPEPPDPRDERVVLGKSVKQWKHLWHYGRTKYFAIAVTSALVIWLALSVITNRPPDLKFVSIGTIVSTGPDAMTAWALAQFPDVKKFQYDNVYLSADGTGENDVVNVQKAFVLLAAADEDTVALDAAHFKVYVTQGAFLNLDGFWAELQGTLPESVLAEVKPMRGATTVEDGGDGLSHVYGLDVTGLGTMPALGLYADSVVLTISVHTKHEDETKAFLTWYLEQTDALKALITPIPTSAATATPAA